MKDTFSSYHPLVNMFFFSLVLFFSMFFMHLACLAISFISAFTYSVYLNGKKALRFNMAVLFPMLVFTALANPLFNHRGGTILTYLPSGNPLTLESIAYGLAAALMLCAVIGWFSCFNTIMTSDKFVYLFGRFFPSLALILSMTLRFVPYFKTQIKSISDAQKCIGRDVSNGSVLKRVHHGMRILSIMVTWALENSIETADSMKGRGYGLPGRTEFSIFRFARRDWVASAYLLLCTVYIFTGWLLGGLYFRYFPTIKGVFLTPYSVSLFIVYAGLCLMPLLLGIKEDLKWKSIRSKI